MQISDEMIEAKNAYFAGRKSFDVGSPAEAFIAGFTAAERIRSALVTPTDAGKVSEGDAVVAEIAQRVSDAEADRADDLAEAVETGERVDLWQYEVSLPLGHVKTILSYLPTPEASPALDEVRRAVIEECAAYHDDRAAHHAACHKHVVSDHHEMMERVHLQSAAYLRALAGGAE